MPIITLTTDFGLQDYYAGALKGALLAKLPDLKIIDISHNIPSFDLLHAAYVLRNVYQHFPKGTIHYVGIGSPSDELQNILLAEINGQWILAHDNGILSLISNEKLEAVYAVGKLSSDWANYYEQLSSIVQAIAPAPPGASAQLISDYRKSLILHPIQGKDDIQGIIVHIDKYGNLVSNVHAMLFEQVAQDRSFTIHLKPHLALRKICAGLHEIPVGDTFAIVNAAGLLSFGVAMGNAAELHGLEKGANIQIQFGA